MDVFKSIRLSIFDLFKKFKFFEVVNKDGLLLLFDSSLISIGDIVKINNGQEITIAPDGSYIISSDKFVVELIIKDGMIAQLINKETNQNLESFELSFEKKIKNMDVKQEEIKKDEAQDEPKSENANESESSKEEFDVEKEIEYIKMLYKDLVDQFAKMQDQINKMSDVLANQISVNQSKIQKEIETKNLNKKYNDITIDEFRKKYYKS